MIVKENKLTYPVEDMLGIAQRENNTKRGYLLVNRFQAKHIPVKPGKAMQLFQELCMQIKLDNKSEHIVFIGFAETATAIGAAVASYFSENVYYIQTTREDMPQRFSIVDFREEHSHATEQRLYCCDRNILLKADKIYFVEDEITTGKTILNFIHALKKNGIHKEYGAVSIVNSMNEEQRKQYEDEKVKLHWLVQLENTFDSLTFDEYQLEEQQIDRRKQVNIIEIAGKKEPRCGVWMKEYDLACRLLADEILYKVEIEKNQEILVLGTEECMYPALRCAKKLEEEKSGINVVCHATTRSPIVPDSCLLKNRISLDSVYEHGRKTFLYHLKKYDLILIITDAEKINQQGIEELCDKLEKYGNENIKIIRWVKE